MRKKARGGDTHRVIQLAPHIVSDRLVANLDDETWIDTAASPATAPSLST